MPWPSGKPFRILSIDGGGVRGILPASVLTELERRYGNGRSAGDFFDLIAGTSTGGIIALGLAIGLPAERILQIYLDHGHEVFPPLTWDFFGARRRLRRIRAVTHHTYKSEPLLHHVRSIFGEKTIGDASARLCVPTFDGFTEVNVFKTPHHPDYKIDWRESLVTVGMATASAPTYLPLYKDRNRYFGDGGVWANNPVMIGLVDALVCYQLDRRQVQILSLGTGDTEIRIGDKQIARGGQWHWREIISSAMHLQSQNATGQAGLLVGRDHLLRLNAPPMPNKPIDLDDYARAKIELPPIALRLVNEYGLEIESRFFQVPADPFPAYYGPRAAQSSSHVP